MHNNLSFFPAGNACGRLYGFEIEFDVAPQEAQPLLDALDVAIKRSRTYENVVYFGVCSKFKAVMGQEPQEKTVFLQVYSTPDGNKQHFQDPVVAEQVFPVFDQYPSTVYHYTSLT